MVWFLVIAAILVLAAIGIGICGHKLKDYRGWPIWAAIALWILLLLSLFPIIGYVASSVDRISCRNTAINANLEWRWSLSTSCMVKFGDRYIPLDRWINITDEGF